jgi:hypothetical protein
LGEDGSFAQGSEQWLDPLAGGDEQRDRDLGVGLQAGLVPSPWVASSVWAMTSSVRVDNNDFHRAAAVRRHRVSVRRTGSPLWGLPAGQQGWSTAGDDDR